MRPVGDDLSRQQPLLGASWRAKSLPLPSCRQASRRSFYLPAASASGSLDIPASLWLSPDTSSGPPAHKQHRLSPDTSPGPPVHTQHKHILRVLRAQCLLIDPDSSGLVPMPLLPRCLAAAGVRLPPGPLADAASLIARPDRMCDWRALLRWLKAHPELISPSLTSAPALVHPGVLTGRGTGSTEAVEAAVASVRSSASGLRPSSSAPTLPRAVPHTHRATAAELKARIKLPFASPAALQWAASGAAGVGGQPGVAAGAAAAAVRRVGGASAAQIYPKLPRCGGGTPPSTARPPALKSTRHSRRNLAQVIQRRLNESDPGAHAREAHTLEAPKSSRPTYVAVVKTPGIHEPVNLLGSARLCARPDHQVAVCDYGESYRSVSPRSSSFTSSLPSLAGFDPEQARRGPRNISALLGFTLHPSRLPRASASPPPPPSPPPSPSQRSQPRPLPCPARSTRVT